MTVSAKKLKISIDSGTTYYTFPGDTADFQNSGTAIKDTVFGQPYESNQTGMINWTMSGNGIYKGFAGYVAKLKASGTSTTMTSEACSLVTGKTYQITNTAKQTFDLAQPITVYDNGVNQTSEVITIDYLYGKVTFASGYSVTGPVTITANYLPMTQIAKSQTWTLTQTSTAIDKSDFVSAQANSGLMVHDYGLKTVAFDLNGFYAVSNGFLATLLSRVQLIIEIGPDGGGLSVARGFFKPMSQQQAGKVGELETEAVKFNLWVPDPGTYPLLPYPFQWNHASGTTLSQAIQNALSSWENSTLPTFQYLYDGTNGHSGAGVITDLTLSGGLDVMNIFAIKIQGSDTLTTVGTG